MITLKNEKEISIMREAGHIVGGVLNFLGENIRPGITTNELDEMAEEYITKAGALPSFKNYRGFPKSICASKNSVVVHGIPSRETLENGDIISIDVGAKYKGFHGDAARTFPVGEISPEAARLIRVTKECFYKGMEFAVAGCRVGDISNAIEKHAVSNGYSVVKALVGHGIGQSLHEPPDVPNFGPPRRGARLEKGMTIAVEPMINSGTGEVLTLDDGWAVVTSDGALSAHYENTIAIGNGAPEILTI